MTGVLIIAGITALAHLAGWVLLKLYPPEG